MKTFIKMWLFRLVVVLFGSPLVLVLLPCIFGYLGYRVHCKRRDEAKLRELLVSGQLVHWPQHAAELGQGES